jgi:phosphoglycerol transferase
MTPALKSLGKALLPYAAVAAVSLLLLAYVLKLWHADLRIPLGYVGDCMVVQAWVKGTLENGWFLHNDAVGAPAALDMHDYPMPENLHLAVMKLIGALTQDYGLTTNLYTILTFPLTAVTALFVLRHFGVGLLPAAVTSVLYAFLPFHLFRARHHLFLASYYLVPLVVMVIVWVYQDRVFFLRREKVQERARLVFGPWQTALAAVVICLLAASAGVYYAFFACFFLLVVGACACLLYRRWYPLATALVLTGTLALGVAANLAPTFLHVYRHGGNPCVTTRDYGFVETGALRIIQMLLPITEHRVPFLSDLKAVYNGVLASTGLVNENDHAALGFVGSVGFLVLVGWFFARRYAAGPPHLFDVLSLLTITGVLLATTGGFGAVFGYFVSPLIRSYNRMCVFLGFFALFAVALLLDALARRYVRSRPAGVAYAGLLAGLLLAGTYDQTSRTYGCTAPFHQALEAQYRSDAEFVARVEASVPGGTAVFQLPYHQFPEARTPHRLLAYDHLRAYLHSDALRWSFGAMKGSDGDLWQRHAAAKPPGELLPTLVCAGFGGLYLDRHGYADAGAAIEAELRRLLGAGPLVSRDGRLAFFDLGAYAAALRGSCTEAEWAARCEAARNPLLVSWRRGFYGLEGAQIDDFVPTPAPPGETGRWCARRGEMVLINSSDRTREAELRMEVEMVHGVPGWLKVAGPGAAATAEMTNGRAPLALRVTVPPGQHRVRFDCHGKRPHNIPDARKLLFRVMNFTCQEVVSGTAQNSP